MSELIVKENFVPTQVFTEDGIDPLLIAIRAEVDKFVPDMTTNKGRDEIRSMARKVVKSKTYLEEKALELTADWAKKKKIVDASRSKFKKELDALRDEVRDPLTQWENIEKDRVEKHSTLLKNLRSRELELDALDHEANIVMLEAKITTLGSLVVEDDAKEFALAIDESILERRVFLVNAKNNQEVLLEEKKELEALREEKRLRDIKEHEDKIAKDAKDKAEKEAQEKAALEAGRVEREKKEANEREERLRQAKLAAESHAIEMEKKAKQDKVDSDKREKERIEAEKIATAKAIEDAKIAERKKIEAENEKQRLAEEKKQNNLKHRAKIIKEIVTDIDDNWNLDDLADAMVSGKIRHVKVVF